MVPVLGYFVGRCPRAPSRMALAMTTAIPIEISTSPMLKTFANGTNGGSAKTSVNGASAGDSTTALFE